MIPTFPSSREAKEFLVGRIAYEAQREGAPLSEVERKMLFFSETSRTLPDMAQVADEFDREYDWVAYERKMARLIKNAARNDRRDSRDEYESWWSAIRLLKREDHYILVLIRRAGLRPPGDLLKLWATGLAVAIVAGAVMIAGIAASDKYHIDFDRYIPSADAVFFYFWVAAVSIIVLGFLFRYTVGTQRMLRFSVKLLGRMFGNREV